jgi:hypothetical protein
MLESTIPVKTAAGRLEIDERKLKIGARQRMVLISINGERTVESIRKQFVAINEIDSLLDELLATGLIEVGEAASGAAVAAISSALPEAPVAAKPPPSEVAEKSVAAPVAKNAAGGGDLAAARDFMSRMLNAKVGLRAFLISQKIDKSTTREALLELLPEFRRLLRKQIDAGRVAEFSAHAEELIG